MDYKVANLCKVRRVPRVDVIIGESVQLHDDAVTYKPAKSKGAAFLQPSCGLCKATQTSPCTGPAAQECSQMRTETGFGEGQSTVASCALGKWQSPVNATERSTEADKNHAPSSNK
eukprot:scaffold7504_cov34-Prasinocladus_malaysianus.AAC.1